MEKYQISIFLTMAVLGVSIFAVIQTQITSQSLTSSIDNVRDSVTDVKNTLKDSISSLEQKELASLEKDFSGFEPELEYRIFSIPTDDDRPKEIRFEVTNIHDDHTYVKNKFTITGDICNNEGFQQGTTFESSNRTNIDLERNEEKYITIPIQDEFFTEMMPDKKGFLLQLELEMNPFTHASGPIHEKEFPKRTVIQFDLNEERKGWMPWSPLGGHMDCTVEPSIWGQVFLNTSDMDIFPIRRNYEFPE